MSTKDEVLKLLSNSNGEDVSGNYIAGKLNVSRSAVWKAITKLKEDGYAISSANKRGYSLDLKNDVLSEVLIKNSLNENSICSNVVVLKEVDSTNNYAKKLAQEGAPHGTAVTAETQTGGKGRLGRSFCSPAGSGIYLSVILRLNKEIEPSMLITSAAAVAVMRAIKKVCGVDTKIKWINDLYLNDRKLCGILTEASLDFETKRLEYVIVGIGINITDKAFPPDIKKIASSLSEAVGENEISRNVLIAEVINQLQRVISELDGGEFLEDYRKNSFVLGSEVNVILPNESYKATAFEITKEAHLLVRKASGEIAELNSGEISIRKTS